jgi:DNA-binding transcriptional regulator YhcF (GntR family)
VVIEFFLDEQSGVTTYLQLVQQVRNALRLGMLEPGDQLPTAREVVANLAINPNTVLKAYRILEEEGLVTGRPGLGTFVTKSLAGPSHASQATLSKSLMTWLKRARAAGLDDDSILALFMRNFRASAEEEIA